MPLQIHFHHLPVSKSQSHWKIRHNGPFSKCCHQTSKLPVFLHPYCFCPLAMEEGSIFCLETNWGDLLLVCANHTNHKLKDLCHQLYSPSLLCSYSASPPALPHQPQQAISIKQHFSNDRVFWCHFFIPTQPLSFILAWDEFFDYCCDHNPLFTCTTPH